MTALQQAAQQALEAMNDMASDSRLLDMSTTRLHIFESAREDLRQALDVEQQDEPFAYLCVLPTKDAGPTKFFTAPSDPRGFPVYTHPKPAQQPLTDEKLFELLRSVDEGAVRVAPGLRKFARAVESAHGIGGEE